MLIWGGETAGALLTGHLVPEIYTLYTAKPNVEAMKDLKLLTDPNGNVELIDMFWNKALMEKDDNQSVPPLLAYADLATSLDSRNRETAERIKQKYLA